MSASGEEIPGFRKLLKESWISDCTWELIAERTELHQKRHKCTSDNVTYYQKYIEKDREVKHGAKRDKWALLDKQTEDAEEAAECIDMWVIYQIAK